MKVLLLGGSGFIGSQVLNALLNEDRITEIIVLSNRRKIAESDKLRIVKGSLSEISKELISEVDVIIHLARMNARRFGQWGRSWAAVQGSMANQRLNKLIHKHNPEVRLIYISGSLMYGNSEMATEESPLNPISFAREYVIAERPFLKSIERQKNVLMIRFPWVLGPGSWFKSFYLGPMQANKGVPLYGDGNNIMSFIHLEDAANCVCNAAFSVQRGILNVAMPEKFTQAEFVELISKETALPIHQISKKELKAKNEKAVYEAFTSSISLQTIHSSPELKYSSVESALGATLGK